MRLSGEFIFTPEFFYKKLKKGEKVSLEKGREVGKFKGNQGRFKENSEREERGNQSLEILTQKHLMNCELEIDDCLMIDIEIIILLV